MHIDRVNLRMTLLSELQLQAKSHSCYSHNDYEEKQNSWILVNISLRSDLTFVAQIEKLLSFCKRVSKLNVYWKAESTWYTKILPKHQLFLPYLEKTTWWLFQFGYDSRKWGAHFLSKCSSEPATSKSLSTQFQKEKNSVKFDIK